MIAPRPLALALLRLLAAYAALCLTTYAAGDSLLRAMAPVFKREFEAWRPEYRVDELSIEQGSASLAVTKTIGDRRGFHARAKASPAFTTPILALSLLAAWPFPSWRRRGTAAGAAAILLLAILMVDLPASVLLAVAEVAQKEEPFPLFVVNNGGRQFLSLLVLFAAIAASRFADAPARARSARERRLRRFQRLPLQQ